MGEEKNYNLFSNFLYLARVDCCNWKTDLNVLVLFKHFAYMASSYAMMMKKITNVIPAYSRQIR